MAKKPEKKDEAQQSLEEQVWNAISAFEQILEAMPNDRASLDALSHAYEQVGDHARAKDYYVRLGNVVMEEGDADAIKELADKIAQYTAEDPKARDLHARMGKFLKDRENKTAPPKPEAAVTQAKSSGRDAARSGFNIADELAFAWNLLEAGELTQEEYASVVQDLTEMSAGENNATVSVIHALEVRGFKGLERVMVFVAKQTSTPIISLSSFDLQSDAVTVLPMDFMVRRGVLVFDFLGNDALAVLLNPYDKQLRQDAEAVAGRKCHFYLCLSSEFDQALTKITKMLTEKDAPKKEAPKK